MQPGVGGESSSVPWEPRCVWTSATFPTEEWMKVQVVFLFNLNGFSQFNDGCTYSTLNALVQRPLPYSFQHHLWEASTQRDAAVHQGSNNRIECGIIGSQDALPCVFVEGSAVKVMCNE